MIYCPCFHSKTNLFFSAIVTFITSDCTEELAKIIVQLDEHRRELQSNKFLPAVDHQELHYICSDHHTDVCSEVYK